MVSSVLRSELDASVNFVTPHLRGYFESRYVRRTEDYFTCYISPQTGCRQACKMCHLTATKQVYADNATISDVEKQVALVFDHYNQQQPARIVNFSFMARGESLVNPNVNAEMISMLNEKATKAKLYPRVCISTIFPKSVKSKLHERFAPYAPDIYYSIYSTNSEFKKVWLPNAKPVVEAFDELLEYQDVTKKIIKLHWAFIDSEVTNNTEEDVASICDLILRTGLRVDINIVRYNPPDDKSAEPSEAVLESRVNQIRKTLPNTRVKLVSRVGLDVKASCGMFVKEGT